MLYGFELMLRVCKWTWWTGWTQRDVVSVVPTLTRALTFPSASILQSVRAFPLGTFISHSPIVHSLSSSAAHYEKPVYVQTSSDIHCEAWTEKRWGRGCGRQRTEWRRVLNKRLELTEWHLISPVSIITLVNECLNKHFADELLQNIMT